MKRRFRPKEHVVILTLAAMLVVTLIGVDMIWPEAFGILVAIAGSVGALVVLYEVRLTKRIAQAEFIRDLQTGFSSDENIGKLWRKLLLKEEITQTDRPLVSSYLTFFETLGLLLSRGAVELRLVDDLFRNRFFTAVGDRGILRTALISQAGAFANIHGLIEEWHDYLLTHRIPIHPGYYAYIQALTEAQDYRIEPLEERDLESVDQLRAEVVASLDDPSWLSSERPTPVAAGAYAKMLGIWKGDRLVAAATVYDAAADSPSADPDDDLDDGPNGTVLLREILVSHKHLRNGLGRTLVELLEYESSIRGKARIQATVHRENTRYRNLLRLLGYKRTDRGAASPQGRRDVYVRELPMLKKRWARTQGAPSAPTSSTKAADRAL